MTKTTAQAAALALSALMTLATVAAFATQPRRG